MKNFITNSGAESLKKRLSELIINSEELKCLVGFFYFSGLKELYEPLIKNSSIKIKILVGLDVDKHNYQIIEIAESETINKASSNEIINNKYFASLRKSINSPKFDNIIFYEQVSFFIQLIKDDRLIIRKTFNPNHAKLYIFNLNDKQVGRRNLFITGSSNLTSSGLATREEFNVEISDYGFNDAEDYFDNLWSEAVQITEKKENKERLITLLEKETLIKKITPFEAFVLVLKNYLDSFEQKAIGQTLNKIFNENGYTSYKYQLDAIQQALAILEKNNGVILTDVVGLGKTIIACAVAFETKKRGIIICPPGLMGDSRTLDAGWNMYKEQFKLSEWEVWSLGDLEKLQERMQKTTDFEIVIVDEAHKFRNQDTQSYEYLKNICRNKQVILLTATPFNNRPADILSLLKLFITPKKSSITLENNLLVKFSNFKTDFEKLAFVNKNYNSKNKNKLDKAFSYYVSLFGEKFVFPDAIKNIKNRSKYLSKQIRDVIEPVTIRRNRLDLQNNPDYKNEVKNLSKVADPKEWFFELTNEQSIYYDTIISKYFADPDEGGIFKGAIYRPFEYEKERKKIGDVKLTESENFEYHSQRNLYDLMRRLLVKRFESSFGSFEKSLNNFKHILEKVLLFIEKSGQYILDRDLLEKIYDKDIDEIEKCLSEYSENLNKGAYPKHHKIYKISDFKLKKEFIEDIKSDLKMFDEILSLLLKLKLVENDPKTFCLIKNLCTQLKDDPKRKIVIFSEYVDTVKYLEPYITKVFGSKLLTVVGDLTKHKLDAIYKNFDASYDKQENDYDILLTSDKLSEGFNLNRAGIVINFDIPWNPVRVIQRVGRINRISKKVFEELYIVNFFPTEVGEELIKSRQIAANKMFLIHNTLGEDAKIFDVDEEPTPAKLFEKIQQNPDSIEEESFRTKAIQEYYKIKENNPKLISELDNFPLRIKVSKQHFEDEMLVFIKKGRFYINYAKYNELDNFNNSLITFEDAFDKIKCNSNEEPIEFSSKFWDIYEEIKNYKETKLIAPKENSIEQQAINSLKTILNIQDDKVFEHKEFIEVLLEDIIDYGTLPDYTMRRIANLVSTKGDKINNIISGIKLLESELGKNYLEKEKIKHKDLQKEVIIAIENRKII